MPTITITAEQADALARGENITIEAPKPKKLYVLTFIKAGNVRQTYHTYRKGLNEHDVVEQWIDHLVTLGYSDFLDGAIIGVCEAEDKNPNCSFLMCTTTTYWFHIEHYQYSKEFTVVEGMPSTQ